MINILNLLEGKIKPVCGCGCPCWCGGVINDYANGYMDGACDAGLASNEAA